MYSLQYPAGSGCSLSWSLTTVLPSPLLSVILKCPKLLNQYFLPSFFLCVGLFSSLTTYSSCTYPLNVTSSEYSTQHSRLGNIPLLLTAYDFFPCGAYYNFNHHLIIAVVNLICLAFHECKDHVCASTIVFQILSAMPYKNKRCNKNFEARRKNSLWTCSLTCSCGLVSLS